MNDYAGRLVEQERTPIDVDDRRCPAGARSLIKAGAVHGWELARLTYSRGPYIGARGQVLKICDWVVLGLLDRTNHRAGVGCWRDGTPASMWLGRAGQMTEKVTFTELRQALANPDFPAARQG